MGKLTFNIMFYLIGLALASIPFILSLRKSQRASNPTWYNITMPIIIVLLFGMGILKTVNDYSDQNNSSTQVINLNTKVSTLINNRKTDSSSNAQFLIKLKKMGITRDSSLNQPKINRSIYNTYIKTVAGSTLNFGH